MAGSQLKKLVSRLCRNESRPEAYMKDVASLVGLGPGLTPTGDDLLVGLAAAAKRFGSAGWLSKNSLDAFLSSLTSLASDATTNVSLQMIEHAARGAYPEPLLRFVQTLGRGNTDARLAKREAGQLSRTGANSGCDMLAGAVALATALSEGTPGQEVSRA
jgi:hypothetical protein